MTLSVITTPPQPEKQRPNFAIKYLDGMLRNIRLFEASEKNNRESLMRIVFYSVRYFARYKEKDTAKLVADFQAACSIKAHIGLLTPRELIQIFPIDKQYDGDKYQFKDYFYTMKMLREHGLDTKIGSNVDNILWDYTNIWMRLFNVAVMRLVDDMRRAEGKQGMIEEFFGIQPWIEHTDAKGKKYMVQKGTGKIAILKKKRPRYLRPVMQ